MAPIGAQRRHHTGRWLIGIGIVVWWWTRRSPPRPGGGTTGSVMRWRDLATTMGDRYRIDPALILGMIERESGGNPQAVSSSGARGLMQLLCSTAQSPEVGMVGSCARLYDPAVNVEVGTKYLRWLIDRKDDVDLAIASYFAGPYSSRLTRIGGWFVSSAVQRYVTGVKAAAATYRETLEA